MPIQILPPQLANQIAAGEVVERPASVVKELVENSLDAGANQIQVDIEEGGARLIRLRDNGIGINKNELSLALARHATSKIASLDDLDSILSFGFRGEALASISSVSRLTLTSRTAEQNEAWQVFAQGREMETVIQPASHPVGTTVEVANLFFNTPARRRFLRSEKTEFAHIDEVIRRIALAKPNIAFKLSHNNKIIRQYKIAQTDEQKLKRIAAICGDDFVKNALQLDWQHNDLHLYGWIAQPHFSRSQNDLAYCYINGRMVRDKVITHAIKQAYAPYLKADQHPAFVLFIDLNPNEVDVNVHPTKHEVRFHQARLIHDFICQGISNALQSDCAQPSFNDEQGDQINEPAPSWGKIEQTDNISSTQDPSHWRSSQGSFSPNRLAAGQNIFAKEQENFSAHSKNFAKNPPHFAEKVTSQMGNSLASNPYTSWGAEKPWAPEKVSAKAQQAYAELLSHPQDDKAQSPSVDHISASEPTTNFLLRCLALVKDRAILLQQQQDFFLLPLIGLQQLNIELQLSQAQIAQYPLLVPISFRLNETQLSQWQQRKELFQQLGFEFSEHLAQQRITLMKMPVCLRSQNIQNLIIRLLAMDAKLQEIYPPLCAMLDYPKITELADGIALLNQTESLLKADKDKRLQSLLIQLDLTSYLEQLNG